MTDEMPITKAGHAAIQNELDHLIKVEREDLKKVIAEARALGDLRENAEYHAAKEKQAHVEGRILQLQSILSRSRIVDLTSIESDKIIFGAIVTLIDGDGGKHTYQVVGPDESDIKLGKISFTGPLGMALIGKTRGDTVVVKAPKGDVEYEIEDFEFRG